VRVPPWRVPRLRQSEHVMEKYFDCVVISGRKIVCDYFCQHLTREEAQAHAQRLMDNHERGKLVISVCRPEVD